LFGNTISIENFLSFQIAAASDGGDIYCFFDYVNMTLRTKHPLLGAIDIYGVIQQ
jgi:hypothetical protein